MSDIQINWPRAIDESGSMKHPIAARRRFAAAVSATTNVIWVQARCRNTVTGAIANGVTISFTRRSGAAHSSYPNQWIIFFDRQEPGIYELQVTPHSLEGPLQAATRYFAIELSFTIQIFSHYENENITDQKDDFLVYGEINANQLGAVTMTESTSNTSVYPTSTFSDPIVFQFWNAQFPSIPSGSYTLVARDNVLSSLDSVTGLEVD